MEVLVYTCGNNGYEEFAPLFIAGALWASDATYAEFGMPDPSIFDRDPAIAFLRDWFPNRFHISQVNFPPTTKPHTVRFLSTPQRKAPCVYIVDSDLVLLDKNFPEEHLAFMELYSLPYANSMRPLDRKKIAKPFNRRMTGLHFTRWEAFYPLPDISDLNLMMNDEKLLAEMVHRKGFPLHENPWFRPVPGIHFSPNREPMGLIEDGKRVPGWGMVPWANQWAEFRSELADLVPLLSGRSADVVERLSFEIGPNLPRSIFTRVYKSRKQANAESISGHGSTVSATAQLVPQLIQLFDRYSIKSMNDAACGDFNWIGPLAKNVSYLGFDLVPEVVEIAQSRTESQCAVFDISSQVLPQADVILCRDCLVHLPEDTITAVVSNFILSGSSWLITTTFPDLVENRKGSLGGWRPINLQAPPFNFPLPVEIIFERPSVPPHPDYGRKALGMWRLADLVGR